MRPFPPRIDRQLSTPGPHPFYDRFLAKPRRGDSVAPGFAVRRTRDVTQRRARSGRDCCASRTNRLRAAVLIDRDVGEITVGDEERMLLPAAERPGLQI